ncbi:MULTISPECIES: hypothetical protein [Bacillus]|uniref:hypothetical protein n=1 Tax=Bacillus TaxID=1386 RepID=UPI00157237EF|nr:MULTISPECIES: hypothetical protein [Bacillus]MBC6975124.1 hypothetical protein [Bacillus sp. Xin]MBY0600366.1 hypothetical protein [Bacillus bingmayongensis]NSW38453.1 hypothetical protein [Bacillus sp. Xin1]
MKHKGLTVIKMTSVGLFLCIGFLGWMNLITLFLKQEWQASTMFWIVSILLIWYMLILLLIQVIQKTTRSYMTRIPQLALFVWFVGTGHFGLLGFVQSQQSTFLTIGFPIFTSIPVILAIVYMVIYRRYANT